MKLASFSFAFCLLLATGCERKLTTAQVKENLEKAMASYLQKQQRPGTAPLKFQLMDVIYYEDTDDYYLCDFTVKLHRPDGTDTTGVIHSRVSKDFSKVIR